jgi:hypothetical protein
MSKKNAICLNRTESQFLAICLDVFCSISKKFKRGVCQNIFVFTAFETLV